MGRASLARVLAAAAPVGLVCLERTQPPQVRHLRLASSPRKPNTQRVPGAGATVHCGVPTPGVRSHWVEEQGTGSSGCTDQETPGVRRAYWVGGRSGGGGGQHQVRWQASQPC